ncbi:MAG: nucleoside-diphosphate kinase [Bacteroidales bacterium]|nr:nucleoside-diphosphate kinase [Bacteroidales bacterium]MCF8454597.1 nucleoside-diphosphate kinase [Bacteroidales bacterium]
MKSNYTFTIIKPGAVSNEHIGPILAMINKAGFHITAMKLIRLSVRQAQVFYEVHKDRPFYGELVEFMTSGPVVVAILEKANAVEEYRKLIGATDPSKAEDGTIRKMFAESIQKNAVHGSDSDENAKQEMNFFFARTERFNRDGSCCVMEY